MATAICDAGPLIHLDELDCLDLLSDFSSILIPGQVWAEVKDYHSAALRKSSVPFQQVSVTIDTSSIFQTIIKTFSLDLGEQAVLSLMQSQSADMILTDDTAARLAAQSLSYRVHGTIGIIIRAIRRKQRTRDEVIDILSSIPSRSTLYVRDSFLNSLISQVQTQA
ncbi:MAG: DNA-binding protein [Chloroflexota bacterium]